MPKFDFVTHEFYRPGNKEELPSALSDDRQADVVILNYEQRYLRRRVIACISGKSVLVDLSTASVLENNDRLVLESGGWINVEAADEELLQITSGNSHQLTIIAYHLGNRHLPVQIEADKLLIRNDDVIKAMLIKLGAQVTNINSPFNPEGGAYGLGRTHGHDHGHDQSVNMALRGKSDAPQH